MAGKVHERARPAPQEAPGLRKEASRTRKVLGFLALDPRHAVRHLLLGFALGGAGVALTVGIYALAGWYHVRSVQFDPWPFLIGGLGGYLLIAFYEEFLFRGVFFRVAEWVFGTIAALVLSSLAFGLVHLGNPGMTVFDALAGAAGGGVVFATLFILTRSLWLAIGVHWAADFWQGSVFGLHPAGTAVSHPLLHSTLAGPQLWIGDTTGGGLVALAIFLPIMIGMLFLTWRRGCFRAAPKLIRRLLHRPV